jgi:hypothetical protein
MSARRRFSKSLLIGAGKSQGMELDAHSQAPFSGFDL